jgi:hypothetical protein
MATYEIALDTTAPAEVVEDLPPAECGQMLFHRGRFWHVDAIEPAQAAEADGRLIVSQTTDEPRTATT